MYLWQKLAINKIILFQYILLSCTYLTWNLDENDDLLKCIYIYIYIGFNRYNSLRMFTDYYDEFSHDNFK